MASDADIYAPLVTARRRACISQAHRQFRKQARRLSACFRSCRCALSAPTQGLALFSSCFRPMAPISMRYFTMASDRAFISLQWLCLLITEPIPLQWFMTDPEPSSLNKAFRIRNFYTCTRYPVTRPPRYFNTQSTIPSTRTPLQVSLVRLLRTGVRLDRVMRHPKVLTNKGLRYP